MNLKVIWEAAKEPLREIVLAAIPGVLVYLEKLDAPWAACLYLFARAMDSYLHERAKVTPKAERKTGLLGLKGLTGF